MITRRQALITRRTLFGAFLVLTSHTAAQTNQPLKTVHAFGGGANDGARTAGASRLARAQCSMA